MFFKLNTVNKHATLTVGSHGIALKKGLGYLVENNITTDTRKEIDRNTVLKIVAFNFQTNKVRLECVKNLTHYQIEIGYKYILDNCVFDQKEMLKPVDTVYVKYFIQNVMDKETALFILVMAMTYICGMFIGKVF